MSLNLSPAAKSRYLYTYRGRPSRCHSLTRYDVEYTSSSCNKATEAAGIRQCATYPIRSHERARSLKACTCSDRRLKHLAQSVIRGLRSLRRRFEYLRKLSVCQAFRARALRALRVTVAFLTPLPVASNIRIPLVLPHSLLNCITIEDTNCRCTLSQLHPTKGTRPRSFTSSSTPTAAARRGCLIFCLTLLCHNLNHP